MSDPELLRILRAMAWERAKGELRAILVSYQDDGDNFERAAAAFERFISEIDDGAVGGFT